MTTNIDESIKELSKWRKDLNYDNGDYYYGGDTTEHSLDVAIDTMRKYQKIEEIVKAWNDMNSFDSMKQISEVIGDGKDD